MDKKQTAAHGEEREHILVCLSPSPSNEKIVRTAAKMADAFGGSFTALYVETPKGFGMDAADQGRLQSHIRLAELLGAEIVTIHGEDVSLQIAEYARLSGATRIVIGRSGVGRKHFWNRPTLTERLIELAPNLDIHIIPDTDVYRTYREKKHTKDFPVIPSRRDLLITALILSVSTAISCLFLWLGFTDANIITIYLLGVLLTSILTKGYTCSVICSVLSVVLFNYFLTEPRLTLHAYDSGYPVTFVIMLAASILTGTLATKLKIHAKMSARDAFRTKILFDTNQLLQKAQDEAGIFRVTATQLVKLLDRDIIFFPSDGRQLLSGKFYPSESDMREQAYPVEQEVLRWVWQNRKRAGAMTKQFPDAKYLYLAIRLGQQVYGVVAILINGSPIDAFEYSILLSILGECAMALDNYHNAKEKEEAVVLAKNEQLRSNLLRTISHDLRTPLTSISGNADTLLNGFDALDDETRRRMLSDIYDDSEWLISLVENLLAITKIGDGSLGLNMSDQVVDDVISEALRHIDRKSARHPISVDCGEEPILAKMDARLIVQVIVNLVNNAVKYTPEDSSISVIAKKQGSSAVISVLDQGPGIPDALKPRVFEMFFTGENKISDSRRSLGLGLYLCRSIISSHGGELTLTDNPPHGCNFSFSLPLSEVNLNE